MSDFSVQRLSVGPNLQARQGQGTAAKPGPSTTTAQQQHRLATADDPTDIIATSPAASLVLGALNSQLSSESQKDFDAKQLKAAIQQLRILQLLGIGLGPEELAKQTTGLAKQIASIAKDYAANSGSALPGAPTPAAAATSEAGTAAAQATSAAATGDDPASTAKAATDQASQAAKAAADKAAQSAQQDAKTAPSGPAAANVPAAASPVAGTAAGSGNGQGTPPDPDQAAADNPGDFFSEVTAAFKELKKLETKALSLLNLSPDKHKKDEAKKLGGEFNQAAASTAQSAIASGASGAEIAAQSIDLSKVAINISA